MSSPAGVETGVSATREERIEAAAGRLEEAARSRTPCLPVRDLLLGLTVADAYEVARINVRGAVQTGSRAVGWKAGLTSAAVQQQLGVDTPDFGVLLDGCGYGDDEPMPLSRLLQPRIEAEVAFVLERDLPDRRVSGQDIIAATAFVLPALEVADSRIAGWDLTILDTVADNASSGLYSLGWSPTPLDRVDLREARMSLSSAGATLSEGTGAACLGHPVNAVVWLANTLQALGSPLKSGAVVLSGALGPMVPVTAPAVFEATIEGVGSVRARFTDD